MLISGLLAMWIAVQWGWVEAYLVTAICVVILFLTFALVIWSTPHQITIDLPKGRIVAGQSAVGVIMATNTCNRSISPGVIELPIGNGVRHFFVPSLDSRGEWDEIFSVITRRRGLISVGLARPVRLDGLGSLRRVRTWDRPDILRAHPRTLGLSFDTMGFQIDVEGATTAKLSSLDVSSHAPRDYEPGDDQRSVRWMFTTRLGRLIAHQFEETRRSYHMIILDIAARPRSSEVFKTAVSAGASLALAALGASRTVSMSTSGGWMSTMSPVHMLDAPAGVEAQDVADVQDRARWCIEKRAGVSVVMIVVNPNVSDGQASHVARLTGVDMSTLVIRIHPGASWRRREPT